MTFPTSEAPTATNKSTAQGPNQTVNIGSPTEGQLLICVGRVPGSNQAHAYPDGWNILKNASQAGGSSDRISVAYKYLAAGAVEIGSPTMLVTIDTASTRLGAWLVWKISGADSGTAPQISADATGASANPNSATLTPTGGTAKDYLVITVATSEGEQTIPYGTLPTDYTLYSGGANTGTAGAVATNATMTGAARELNTGEAIDPGAFTMSASDDWLAWTIIVHPSAAQSVSIGVATQASAAQALDKDKTKSLPVVTQLSAAQALAANKLKILGVATQPSAAQAVDKDKTLLIAVATQVMSALDLRVPKLSPATQASAAQALAATKSVTIAFATSVNTALAVSFTQGGGPIEMTLTPAVQSSSAQPLDADKHLAPTIAVQVNASIALDADKTLSITIAVQSMSAQAFTKFKSATLPPVTSPSAAQALDKDKVLGITLASSASSAQTLGKVKAPTLPVATQPSLAFTFSLTEFANISPATQPSAAQALQKSKSLLIPTASSTSTARDLRVPKLTPAVQQSFAVALSIGDLQFFNLTPAVQSSTAQPLIKNKTVVITFAVTPQSAQTLTGRKFATLAFATSPQAAQTLTAFKSTTIPPASVTQSARDLVLSRHATILPALQASVAQALSGHKRATLTPAVTTNIAVNLEIEGLTTFVTFSGTAVLTSHQGLAAGTVDANADGDASATTGLQS